MKDLWISVTDCLPELDHGLSKYDVLCWVDGEAVVGRYSTFHLRGLRWICNANDEFIEPTHWQPIKGPT